MYKLTVIPQTNSQNFWKMFLKQFGIFVLGFWLLFFIFSLKFGAFELFLNLLNNQGAQSKTSLPFIKRWAIYTFDYIKTNVGPFLLSIFIAVVVRFFLKCKQMAHSQSVYLLLLPLSYLFFCALLFSKHHIPRLFIPMVPALLLFLLFQIYEWRKNSWIPAALVTFVFAQNLSANLRHINSAESYYPQISKELSKLVPPKERVLLTPLSLMSYHLPLTKKVYREGRAIYLLSSREGSFEEVISQQNISYVWISDVLFDDKLFGEYLRPASEERLRTLFKMAPATYDPELEKKMIRSKLSALRFRMIHKSHLGELYASP